MKAVVFKDVGKIALEDVQEPVIQDSKDAIVRLTMSAICGTDLHFVRGSITGMQQNTILGHEGVGIIEKVGAAVTQFKVGDRVIVPSTIGCGMCDNCLKKLFSQCNRANPNGPECGTAFYGGPKITGPFQGMQAEKVRVPYADVNLVKVSSGLKDEQIILLSDILPTAYMAVEMANPQPDDTVAVFGCGPVGQLTILVLKALGVKHILAIDRIPFRLKIAQQQGAVPINFDLEDPVAAIKRLTNNKGADKVIDAVGVDANHPHYSWREWFKNWKLLLFFARERKRIAPRQRRSGNNWIPGTAPSQVLLWAVASVAKAGTISIIGVYSDKSITFPVGYEVAKNLSVRAGNCNHRAYFPKLLEWVTSRKVDLEPFLTHVIPFEQVIEAYKQFDRRDDGCLKVALKMPMHT